MASDGQTYKNLPNSEKKVKQSNDFTDATNKSISIVANNLDQDEQS